MEIKDFLHLYIGAHLPVEYGCFENKKTGILSGYDELFGWQVFRPDVVLAPYLNVRDTLIKPILRPLSDIKPEEYDYMGQHFPLLDANYNLSGCEKKLKKQDICYPNTLTYSD
jgi:hypothetical protein